MGFRRVGLLIGACFAVASSPSLANAATSRAVLLEDARWARADADLVRLLTTSPGECLRPPASAAAREAVEVGRAAFRTPFLFGGTAARTGLSCNSCHRDGRDNPDFFLDGLSGDAGTADVTSSIFSRVREDGVFNPVPIPTLVDAAKKSSFGAARPHGSLETFIASAVDEEFDGAAPSGVVAAVAAYVAHLDSNHCPTKPSKTTLRSAMNEARRTLVAAQAALQAGDVETADFLLLAARGDIGRVHARFVDVGREKERAALEALSGGIGDLRTGLARGERAPAALPALIDHFDQTVAFVHKARKKSLYEPKQLKRWIEGGR